MIHSYDKNYLLRAQNLLGIMFDFSVNEKHISLENFYNLFLFSRISSSFETGDTSVLAGKSGLELALEVLEQNTNDDIKYFSISRSKEYWVGWALSYFQWYSGLKFFSINKYIQISEILQMYNPYHEMDISQFCDHLIALYNQRKKQTNLKLIRKELGLTQNQLSQITNIPLRTLQQYEQKQKNINAASVQSIITLSKALKCSVDDLIEL